MTQIQEKKRSVAGAELFVGDAEMNILANIGDGAFDEEKDDFGYLLGMFYHDLRGIWATMTSFSRDDSRLDDAVGWFRTSETYGTEMSAEDVGKHLRMFGGRRAFAVMIDPLRSSMAMYKVEDGVPIKIGAAILDGS